MKAANYTKGVPSRGKDSKVILLAACCLLAVTLAAYALQGVRSSYGVYPSNLGYLVRAFDVTTSWVGAKNLLIHGISPYSEEGQALVEEAYFGRPLRPEDEKSVKDKHHYVYPLYAVLVYWPTVHMAFQHALMVLWVVGVVMLLVGSKLWLQMVGEKDWPYTLITVAFFMTWSTVYLSIQMRQPLLFVFLFILLSICLIVGQKRVVYAGLGGMVLFLSTIKPQSSILAVVYILGVWSPSMNLLKNTLSACLGFVTMFVMSMLLTFWFAPGWVMEFLRGLRDYRGYAGTTGAEAMWGSGMLCIILAVFFAAVGGWMCVISYRAREQRLHLIVFSYILALQGVIFPAHSYVTILGFPAVALALHRGWVTLKEGRWLPTFAIGAGVCIVAYMVYRFWLVMFSEAGLPDKFTQILLQALHYFPSVKFPPFLVLGLILFIDWTVDHFRSRNGSFWK